MLYNVSSVSVRLVIIIELVNPRLSIAHPALRGPTDGDAARLIILTALRSGGSGAGYE